MVAKTKHGEISLDQLAEIQPGMARLMDEVARRYYYTYYAAKGGNWQLASHQLKEMISVLKIASITRPKYSEDILKFEKEYLSPIGEAIKEMNWEKFEETYQRGIKGSDFYHDKYGKTYIRYTLPPEPPTHLELKPENLQKRRT